MIDKKQPYIKVPKKLLYNNIHFTFYRSKQDILLYKADGNTAWDGIYDPDYIIIVQFRKHVKSPKDAFYVLYEISGSTDTSLHVHSLQSSDRLATPIYD